MVRAEHRIRARTDIEARVHHAAREANATFEDVAAGLCNVAGHVVLEFTASLTVTPTAVRIIGAPLALTLSPAGATAMLATFFYFPHLDTPPLSTSTPALAVIGTPMKSNVMHCSTSAMTCSTSGFGTSSTSSS